MPDDFTNLLPRERRSSLRRDYFLRLGVVGALFVTALALAGVVLLLPTYVFLETSTRAKEARLATVEATFEDADQTKIFARLAALSSNAAMLATLSDVPSASGVIRNVLAVPHQGVVLSRLVYTPPPPAPMATSSPQSKPAANTNTGKNKRILAISGTAATRDALRTYQLALQGAPFSFSADLPVSAYAQDTDISFTITLTLVP